MMIEAALRIFAIHPVNRTAAGTDRAIAAFFTILRSVILVVPAFVNHIHKVNAFIKDRLRRNRTIAKMHMAIIEGTIDINCTTRKSRGTGLKAQLIRFEVAKLESLGKLPTLLNGFLHNDKGFG